MNVKNKIGCLRDFMNVGEFGLWGSHLYTFYYQNGYITAFRVWV
jgi:hypothetical protein